ncbi:MAG TPA: pitrilysin family protein [Thermoplasmata archaeon]|nr:pitrilysin family protein [Thermoplasmata archaeon]
MARDSADPRRVHQETLDGGLVLATQAAPPGSASFSATYVGPAGWAYDPVGREGSALAVSQLLTSGAGKWDRRALDRHLDRLGATLTRACDPESSEVTVWGPRELADSLLELLEAVVLRPHLNGSDLDRVRRQLLERQLREETQPDSRADREVARAIFPSGHPYRLTGLGTPASIRAITAEGVRRFHRAHFSEGGGLVTVTGAPSGLDVRTAVRRRFREFAAQRAPAPPRRPAVPRPADREIRVTLPGRSQVEIRVGGESIARESDLFPGVFLANEVLGGRPLLSRLFQTVRESRGLAYHASSEVQAMRWGGYWVAGAGTGPERVAETQRVVQREIRRISEELVRPAELDRIRESAIGELPLSLETTSGAHDLAVDIAYYSLPERFLLDWPATLRAVRPAALRRAAEEGMDGRRSVTVVAGPPAGVSRHR